MHNLTNQNQNQINGIHALWHEPGIKPIKALPGYEACVGFPGVFMPYGIPRMLQLATWVNLLKFLTKNESFDNISYYINLGENMRFVNIS